MTDRHIVENKISINEISNISLFEEQGGSHFDIYTGYYKEEKVIVKAVQIRNITDISIRKHNIEKFKQNFEIVQLQYDGMVRLYGWGDDFGNNNFLVKQLLNTLPSFIEEDEFQKIFNVVLSVTRKLYLLGFNWTPSLKHVLYDDNNDPKLIDYNDDNDKKTSFLYSKDYYDYSLFLEELARFHNGKMEIGKIRFMIDNAIQKMIIEEYQSLIDVHQPIFFDILKNTPKKETDPNDPNFGNLVPANRNCYDREKIIKDNIDCKYMEGKTLLDFGTNVGWFCFCFDKIGINVTGVDFDERKINFNKLLCEKFSLNCNFIFEKINADFIRSLDSYDMILGLSIFHLFFTQHKYSYNDWVDLISLICSKAKKYFIIEVSSDVFEPLNIDSFDKFCLFINELGGFSVTKIIGYSNEGRPLILCER